VEVWKRHFLGEKQHHIAQAFGVNQGRISEILKERRHPGSRLVALGKNPLADLFL
jgi:predicted XRE-type DNA-binding protein